MIDRLKQQLAIDPQKSWMAECVPFLRANERSLISDFLHDVNPRMKTYIFYLMSNYSKEDREDVNQELLTKAFIYIPRLLKLSTDKQMWAYLYKTAYSTVIDFARRNRTNFVRLGANAHCIGKYDHSLESGGSYLLQFECSAKAKLDAPISSEEQNRLRLAYFLGVSMYIDGYNDEEIAEEYVYSRISEKKCSNTVRNYRLRFLKFIAKRGTIFQILRPKDEAFLTANLTGPTPALEDSYGQE